MRIGILGAGNMAKAHADAFLAAGATVVGFTSRTRAKAEALAAGYPGAVVADSVPELAERGRVEGWVIAASVLAIPDAVRTCLPTGLPLLVEKPAGPDLSSAEALAAEVEGAGVSAFVALNRRCYASTRAILAELGEGPRFVKVQDQQSRVRAREVGHPEEVVQNWQYANSIHLVDLLRTFARGEPSEVRVLQRPGPEGGVLAAHLEFSSGDRGLYEAVWEGPGPWAATVHVGNRRYAMQPLEQATRQIMGVPGVETIAAEEPGPVKPGLLVQAQAFLAGGNGLSTLADGLGSMRLAHALYDA